MGLMLKRRLKDAGLPPIFSPHSFRVLVDEMTGSIDDLPLAAVGQLRKLLLHGMPEFHSALPLRKDNKRLPA